MITVYKIWPFFFSCIPHCQIPTQILSWPGLGPQSQVYGLCQSLEILNGIWVTQCSIQTTTCFGSNVHAFSSIQPSPWHTHTLIHLVLTPGLYIKKGPWAKRTHRELATNTVEAEDWGRLKFSLGTHLSSFHPSLSTVWVSGVQKLIKYINIYV